MSHARTARGALLLAAALGLQAAAAQTPAADPALAAFQGTDVPAKVAGRKPVQGYVRDVTIYPDPELGPAWYVDTRNQIAGTRDGLFELRKGRLVPLSKAATRAQQQRLAARTDVAPRHKRVFGDGDPAGKRELLFITAFDCGPCNAVDEVLETHAAELPLEIHYLFSLLDDDSEMQQQLRNAQCAADSFAAYERFSEGEEIPATPNCPIPLYATGYATTLLGAPYLPYIIDRKSGRHIRWNGDEEAFLAELKGE